MQYSHEQLGFTGDVANNRRRIIAVLAGGLARGLPNHLPGAGVECCHEAVPQVGPVHNDQRLVQHRRRSVAVTRRASWLMKTLYTRSPSQAGVAEACEFLPCLAMNPPS